MAQEVPVFGSHSQAIVFQESGTGCTRAGIRGRRRRDAGNNVCTPPRPTQNLAVANKATMDAMMELEQMNAILGGGGGRTRKHNKENTPPATNATRGGDDEAKKVKRKKKLCPHCNMFVWMPTRTSGG